MKSLKEQLIEAAEAHCTENNIGLPRLGRKVAYDNAFFSRIMAGGKYSTEIHERFMAFFSDHNKKLAAGATLGAVEPLEPALIHALTNFPDDFPADPAHPE